MSHDIFLPFLQRSRRKSWLNHTAPNETRIRGSQTKTIHVHTRKGSVLETSILNGIQCPVCCAKDFVAFDLLRAHVACFHPRVDFQLNLRSVTEYEATAEVWLNYDSFATDVNETRRLQSKRDALFAGEERYLLNGKLFARKRSSSAASSPVKSWTPGFSIKKRAKRATALSNGRRLPIEVLSPHLESLLNSPSGSSSSGLAFAGINASSGETSEWIPIQTRSTDNCMQQDSVKQIPGLEDKFTYYLRSRASEEQGLLPPLKPRGLSNTAQTNLSRTSSVENLDPKISRHLRTRTSPDLSSAGVALKHDALSTSRQYRLRSSRKMKVVLEQVIFNDNESATPAVAGHSSTDFIDLNAGSTSGSMREKRLFPVPHAPKGVTFYTSVTKQPLKPGEYLTDSDDDVNEDWVRSKRYQIIDSADNVPHQAEMFMKKWNAHFEKEDLRSDQFFAAAFSRFVALNDRFLGSREMTSELKKVRKRLRAAGLIENFQVLQTEAMLPRTKLANDARPAPPPPTPSFSTRCVCGEDVVDVGNAILCSNEACDNPEYHISCVDLATQPFAWLCPVCRVLQPR